VRWRPQRGGRSVLGTAVARADLAALDALVRRHGLRLRSVTGELLAVLEAHRDALPAAPTVVAVARATGTQIAALREGAVSAVHFEGGRADAGVLADIAQRALRLHGVADDTLAYRVDCDAPLELPAAEGGWERWPDAAWLQAA
jgi:hypothetical protein